MSKIKSISLFIIMAIFLAQLGHAASSNLVAPEPDPNSLSFYNFKEMPMNQLTDKIGMRFITTPQFTVIEWTLKQGAKLPPHSHLNSQVSQLVSGKLQVLSDGKTYELFSDQILSVPSYVQHGFVALEDSVIYEQQTPVRQDFLEPDFIQRLSAYLAQNQD